MDNRQRVFALTLDLEADFSGALHEEYALFHDPQRLENLLIHLKERGVKLSVFVVGELLQKFPETIELFAAYGTEFHGHSYSHDPAAPDSEEEIRQCRDSFVKYFGYLPLGYRAPDGKISPGGIKNLEKYGFKFDASIFPSYYPNPFKYLFRKSRVHMFPDSGVVEIPNTPISPVRIMLSLSYIKLMGSGSFSRLLRWSRLPDIAVFGSHLHDFFTDKEALDRMPMFWKIIYSRNHDKGPAYLDEVLDFFQSKGFSFVHISEVYTKFTENI